MVDIFFDVEPVSVPVGGRGKPKMAVRGNMRKQIRHLKKTLENLVKADLRESSRGERLFYTPYLFQGTVGSPNTTAINRLISRCETALAARIS